MQAMTMGAQPLPGPLRLGAETLNGQPKACGVVWYGEVGCLVGDEIAPRAVG